MKFTGISKKYRQWFLKNVNNRYKDSFENNFDGSYESLRHLMDMYSEDEPILAFYGFDANIALSFLDCRNVNRVYFDRRSGEFVDVSRLDDLRDLLRNIYNDYQDGRIVTGVSNGLPDSVIPENTMAYFSYGPLFQNKELEGYTEYELSSDFFATSVNDGENDRYIFSEWSDIASCGKDAKKYEPLTAKDIPTPVITNLRMTDEDFNGNPVVAYTLTVPEDLMKKTVDAEAEGGSIVIETFARVKGDAEWTNMGNSDWEIKPGEMKSALVSLMNEAHPKIDANTPIELRVRYRCSQPDMDDVFSEYSQTLVFETTEISNPTQPVPTDTQPAEETTTVAPEPEKEDKCPLCHFCPQPLGLCIFIWLLIILIIAVVVYVVIRVVKKKDKNKENK